MAKQGGGTGSEEIGPKVKQEAASESKRLENLAKAMAENQRRREAGEKIEVLDPIEKARRAPRSMRRAITAMCFQCMGGSDTPNVRWEVANCLSAESCPLWPLRPWQSNAEPSALADARVMCRPLRGGTVE